MSLHADLLTQAKSLARLEKGKPKQASLRRAVSCAYYSIFHLLVSEGAALLGSKLSKDARAKLLRSFVHADMKTVCTSYTQPQNRFNAQIAPLLSFPLQPELVALADLFVLLQEERHSADYDVAAVFNRADVLTLIQELKVASAGWATVRTSDNAKVFLADLLLRKSWSRQ